MTIRTTKPAINLREELASLRNQGGYSEQKFYFDNHVVNGTFDNDVSGWTSQLGAVLSHTGSGIQVQSTASNSLAYQNFTADLSKKYIITANLVSGAGTIGVSGTFYSFSGGTLSGVLLAGRTNNKLDLAPSANTTAVFDNIAVFEADASNDVIYTMPKGWKPKDVFEDGLLQREGSAHDYEVVYDGFDYKVKPTVAPTASTQTTVIGVKA